ncbi:hypothetical protein VSR01_00035 [Actinacidiphila sp. DG2A-62]|uniref:hypothetical protein n=1 Tax=Actinacidiphila sp. DG2A-62 TaxID=3108821 RepID=UPI002DB67EAC|nr:hypothetical protein [Actinacidiphila sp. DG2A-62]MEC3992017.1 hypothetical protein [Actinacidiphila sp. DG2A-62]
MTTSAADRLFPDHRVFQRIPHRIRLGAGAVIVTSIAAVAQAGAVVAKSAIEQRGLTRRAEIRAQTQRSQQSTQPGSSD